MRKNLFGLFLFAFAVSFLMFPVSAQDKINMVITYEGGTEQSVTLDNPSSAIVKIEFKGAAVTTLTPTPKEYTDTRGNTYMIPLGKMAFADRVVEYNVGNPAPDAGSQITNNALGEPNYIGETGLATELTLGTGGSVVLEFTQVYLIDGEGPDITVFETGPAVEPTILAISKDASNWVEIGKISGGKASVDIHDFVQPGDKFSFVRLIDPGTRKEGPLEVGGYPGADIDAVAALNCIAK
ncbi:MAG: hypothetical protein V1843_01390 [bacterium]